MKQRIVLFIFFIVIGLKVFSQSCPNSVIYDSTNHIVCSGDTIQLNCGMPYVILSPKVFAPGASNNYIVESIPYSPPCPYNISPTAIEYYLPSDDIWGPIMNLNFGQPSSAPQFKFSFYGQNNLTQCVVGSNGLLSWDLSVASLYCAWNFENENPIPNSGFIYKNCIYGPYHDIDFAAVRGIGEMYFEISGTYPCRKIVLSFDNVPMYRCNEMRAYHMIVLYETTNTIEFYMQNKPICSDWNGGKAILGIQNAAGTQATVVSNYNLPNQWSATNQAWRIRPQGNLYSYTNWYKRPVNGGTRTSIPTDTTYLITANPTSEQGTQWYIMETKIVRLDSVELTFSDSCIVKPYNLNEFIITHNGDTSHYDTICSGSNINVQFRGGDNYRMIPPIVQEIIDTNSTILTPLVDTTYIFEAKTFYGNNQAGCTRIDSFHVHVSSPNLELGENKIICRPEELKLWNIHGHTTGNYMWYYNVDNPISIEDTLILNPQSTSYIYLKLTDSINCFAIDSVLISVNERPEFNIIGTTSICRGMYSQLRIEPPLLNCSYLWNMGQITDSINVNPQINTWYNVIVSNNNNNCSRIDSVQVIVANPISNTIYAEICNGEIYNLFGFNDSIGGLYTKTLQTINGCDSTINLNLQVNQKYNDTIEAEICQGEAYHLFGFNENEEGFYPQVIQTIKGCDSIVNLNLRVNPIYTDTIIVEICQGQTYNQNDFNLSQEGFYTHLFQTIKGCDSIVNLDLHINPIYTDTIISGICQGQTYNQNGFNVSESGFYTQNLNTIKGCDSIICLNLSYLDYYDTIEAIICEKETYNQYGFNENNEGFYTHSFQTINGCDSILNLKLIVNPIFNDTILAEICQGEIYNQFGFNENRTGFYHHSFQTINGCDSIINLCLQVNPTYNDTIRVEICQGETYNQYGFNESLEGFYTQYLQTIKGCDSIINLNLINPDYIDTIKAEICEGETYNLNGFNETQEGFYTKTLQTVNGCDSIVNLNLHINPKYNITLNSTICEGKSYTLNGFNESTSGNYTQHLLTYKGCDSIINLELSVIETPTNYSLIEDKYVVAEDFPIIVDVSCDDCFNYLWNTGARDSIYNINHIGNYYVTISHRCGEIYDSIIVVYPEVNVFVPNSFTPLEISNNTFFPIFESTEKVFIEVFEIYNRWGAKIYSSNTKSWDGRYKGKLSDSGVYVWRLLYKTKYTGNKLFEKTGDINLIR